MRKSLRKRQINEMVNALPLSYQTEAENRLAVLESISDIKLMVRKTPSSHIEDLIKSNCKFYIGITERPKERWNYWMERYKEMALWVHPSKKETVPMEKYLISRFRASHLMANLADGGQIPSAATPHFWTHASRQTSSSAARARTRSRASRQSSASCPRKSTWVYPWR